MYGGHNNGSKTDQFITGVKPSKSFYNDLISFDVAQMKIND